MDPKMRENTCRASNCLSNLGLSMVVIEPCYLINDVTEQVSGNSTTVTIMSFGCELKIFAKKNV